ncbi:MAG: hypothetical protein WAV82_12190, partial [Methylobacter sp.]
MFNRVIVDIIEMAGIVLIIPQGMLPKSALPNPAPPLPKSRTVTYLFASISGQIGLGEFLLDPSPTRRVASIAFRQ